MYRRRKRHQTPAQAEKMNMKEMQQQQQQPVFTITSPVYDVLDNHMNDEIYTHPTVVPGAHIPPPFNPYQRLDRTTMNM